MKTIMFRRELTQDDLVRMCVPQRYWSASFSEIHDGGDPNPKQIAAQYLKNFKEMVTRGAGLLLWGPNGPGKTCMAVVIGKEARRRGFTVLFVEVADLKRAVIDKEMFDADLTTWERAKSVDFLILDDLGKGVKDSTGFGSRLIDELVRARNARGLVTFVTTNMSPKAQLEDELKPSTLHSLKECAVPVLIDGPDRREDAKQGNLQALMS